MRVGVTGSRYGPVTDIQAEVLKQFLKSCMGKENTLFHGACAGVDEEAVMMAHDLGYTCVALPPNIPTFISEASLILSIEIRPEEEYLTRDRNIVEECEILLVVPDTFKPKPHSGTWYTSSYAKKIGRKRTFIYPDGTTEEK